MENRHTPAPWSPGRDGASIITLAIPEPDPRVREHYGGLVICENVRPRNLELICHAPTLIEAIATMNDIRHLSEFIYDVREREGMGWDGPNVQAWGQSCDAIIGAITHLRKLGVLDVPTK